MPVTRRRNSPLQGGDVFCPCSVTAGSIPKLSRRAKARACRHVPAEPDTNIGLSSFAQSSEAGNAKNKQNLCCSVALLLIGSLLLAAQPQTRLAQEANEISDQKPDAACRAGGINSIAGDNAWMLTSSRPGIVHDHARIGDFYGGLVRKKNVVRRVDAVPVSDGG